MSTPKIRGQFPSTHWSIIVRLRDGDCKAVEEIFNAYRYPLYGYLRAAGMKHEDAEDLLQDFFAKMLRTEFLLRADQERGRLRSLLLVSLSRLRLSWQRSRASRRGPERPDADCRDSDEARWQREQHGTGETPERFYERRWAMELVRHAKERLRKTYRGRRAATFEALSPLLSPEEPDGESAEVLAARLGLTEGALRVALHRLRSDFRECLIEEVRRTVGEDGDVKDEVNYLLDLFQKR